MSATFHLFPLLPTELRLEIWRLAIRNTDVAGVNFVSLDWEYRPSGSSYLVTETNFHLFVALLPAVCKTLYMTPCERCDDDTFDSSLRGNESSYLLDSGLWDACRESREVMLHRFGGSRAPVKPDTEAAWSAHTTCAFDDENVITRHFTFFPCRDLFVIPPPELNASTEKKLYIDWRFGPRYLSLQDLRHFAFQFEPAWASEDHLGDNPSQMRYWLTLAAMFLKKHATIYLIDYRLERRQEVPESSLLQQKEVFHASDGIYVEVMDEEKWCYYEEGNVNLNPPCFEFIRDVKDHVNERSIGGHAKISILAWEPDVGSNFIPNGS